MASAPLIGVLAIQGDVAEHVSALERAGARIARVRRPGDLAGLAGLVLPGGESTTIGRLASEIGLAEAIRDLVARGGAVWGTCAGLILLADRVDGPQQGVGGLPITVRRNAFGRQVDSFEVDLDVRGLESSEPYRAVFIRAPAVTAVEPGVQVLAALAADRIVAVRHDRLLGTAFHPELWADLRFQRLFLTLASRGATP